MRNILVKEIRLSASILSFCFIAFGLMFFLPGYPILCGVFFVTLGIYQSFLNSREANDILFSALLPIAKKDVVKGKYIFVIFIEALSLILMAIVVVLRMTILADSAVYLSIVMMNANLFSLGAAFYMFGMFNLIFVAGFFKTGYNLGKPFIIHIIVAFINIGIFEALHHFPGLYWINSFGFDYIARQIVLLIIGITLFIILTAIGIKLSVNRFEKIDL